MEMGFLHIPITWAGGGTVKRGSPLSRSPHRDARGVHQLATLLMELDAEDEASRLLAADALYRLGRLEEAHKALLVALSRRPQAAPVLARLGLLQLRRGFFYDANQVRRPEGSQGTGRNRPSWEEGRGLWPWLWSRWTALSPSSAPQSPGFGAGDAFTPGLHLLQALASLTFGLLIWVLSHGMSGNLAGAGPRGHQLPAIRSCSVLRASTVVTKQEARNPPQAELLPSLPH
ncbi:hypothetical protein P7K49_015208 [Saguinus oedipus]|uniref:Uncharacterized protein n=1 Tax=Saguinus oedipus TaxID=9490 RepID=A0ABQ9V8K5_SAGOE|nr:hypothetical protein P7K49_015208 [Saguinus oedipus]